MATEKPNPELDGIEHINIYSKGKTELGRSLSNFSHTPIETPWGVFQSIEGFWFWLKIKPCVERDKLRSMHGFKAKQYGSSLIKNFSNPKLKEEKFRQLIREALRRKITAYPDIRARLLNSTLPLLHYYAFGPTEKGTYGVVDAGFEWITEEWDQIRKELKEEKFKDVEYIIN